MKLRTTVILLVVGLPAVLLASLVIRDLQLKSEFGYLKLGASRADVVQALGEPHAVVRCGQFGGNPPPDCVKEFSYLSILSFTDVWIVSFDANDAVVRKLRYRSP
jgi:hypothetical protein